jgi:hypothetical protein
MEGFDDSMNQKVGFRRQLVDRGQRTEDGKQAERELFLSPTDFGKALYSTLIASQASLF